MAVFLQSFWPHVSFVRENVENAAKRRNYHVTKHPYSCAKHEHNERIMPGLSTAVQNQLNYSARPESQASKVQ